MYAYSHDPETGGLLLNQRTLVFSKEPRPVYSRELDLLGLDKHYRYVKQDEYPYMWAEANCYWYRGQLVAKTRGGTLDTLPRVEFVLDSKGKRILPDGETLLAVDVEAMVQRNRELLEVVEQVTIKKIYDVYKRYRKRLDCFHVAFSGGKDSIVLLDLVRRALPKSSFIVVFGDTGMEFPDTYDAVDAVEKICRENEIEFYRASSHLAPEDSWRLFGPPSRVLRWCCYVHKSAPQTLRLREVLGKSNFVGMAFVGVRAHESMNRADYDYENYGKKQKGQYSHNSILEWTSAEIWLYIYAHDLVINNTYRKGNSRAGCLLCPMGGGKSDSFRGLSYGDEMRKYTRIIAQTVDVNSIQDVCSYVAKGGWASRGSGRDLKDNPSRYSEEVNGDFVNITISDPIPNWREWFKTLGEMPFELRIRESGDNYVVAFPKSADRTPHAKRIKQVCKKAVYCVGCRTCEAHCRNGCISFVGGLRIEDCVQCGRCHTVPHGCHVADSRKIPLGGKRMESLNTFEEHAPKPEWVADFFSRRNDFLSDMRLGPNQQTKFKRFLRESSLIDGEGLTEFAKLIAHLGWETVEAWGLILVELGNNNRQVRWYIENMDVGTVYPRNLIERQLIELGHSEKMARAIVAAFKRLCNLPFGTKLSFGTFSGKTKDSQTLTRTKCTLDDSRVVLYSLYKFAEACDSYYQFTLTRLLDHTVESEGLSPTQIFGFDHSDMERFLNGLSVKYPDFIHATFTHDLDKITLRDDKTSLDVLELFRESS
jgi:phosphoadenosine phosphosulfate reductase